MFELEPALRRVIEMEGSDLHLKVPSQPLIRRHGRLEPIEDPLQLERRRPLEEARARLKG
jgi:Tfp pilus assembly pilus retraction ATPase PilT